MRCFSPHPHGRLGPLPIRPAPVGRLPHFRMVVAGRVVVEQRTSLGDVGVGVLGVGTMAPNRLEVKTACGLVTGDGRRPRIAMSLVETRGPAQYQRYRLPAAPCGGQ